MNTAVAIAHPNIALIKYWGDVDGELHIPENGSISMNLEELLTRTRVTFDKDIEHDQFFLNGIDVNGASRERVSLHLDRIRELAGMIQYARVESWNNFPMGAGIASSASGYAALSLAACKAAGLEMDEDALSRLARKGSGSACRSIPGGFVEWQAGGNDQESYARSIANPSHWELVDCVVVISREEKTISSREGHTSAATSPIQHARVADAPRRLDICRRAIMERNFKALAEVVEQDSNLMHAVMMTSRPPLIYWLPESMAVMRVVEALRKEGLPACYTVDAGPNVHVVCPAENAEVVSRQLQRIPGILEVLVTHPGGPAILVEGE